MTPTMLATGHIVTRTRFAVSSCSKALPLFPELPLSGSPVELWEIWERFSALPASCWQVVGQKKSAVGYAKFPAISASRTGGKLSKSVVVEGLSCNGPRSAVRDLTLETQYGDEPC